MFTKNSPPFTARRVPFRGLGAFSGPPVTGTVRVGTANASRVTYADLEKVNDWMALAFLAHLEDERPLGQMARAVLQQHLGEQTADRLIGLAQKAWK